MKAVFDTNILIDYLKGIKGAADEMERFDIKAISVISYIEILVGLHDNSFIEEIKIFLDTFELIAVNKKVADLSVIARKKYRLKVPDAIILATAQSFDALLITRNTKDFSPLIACVRNPYEI